MVKIDAYRFGEIVVDGLKYHNDIIIFSDHILDSWWRKKGHEVQLKDLEEVLREKDIEVLVIGKGDPGYMDLNSETKKALEARGIQVILQPTKKAWKTFNAIKEIRKTVGAFHLTC